MILKSIAFEDTKNTFWNQLTFNHVPILSYQYLIMKNQVHQHKLFGPIYNYDEMKWANAAWIDCKWPNTKWPKNSVNKTIADFGFWWLLYKWINSFFYYWPFRKVSRTIQWIIKQFPHLKIGSRKVIDRGSAPIWHPGFYLKSADNQGNCCQWIQKEISQNGHRGNLCSIQGYTSQVLFIYLKKGAAKDGLVPG